MSFPLTFEYLPENRLFVNFIRCEGDDVEGGEIVNENFVLNIINEIEKKEPNFFDNMIINKLITQKMYVSFYTHMNIVLYKSKLSFNKFLPDLLKMYLNDAYNLRACLEAFIQSLKISIEQAMCERGIFTSKNRVLIFDEDIEYLKSKVSIYISKNFKIRFQEINELINMVENKVRETGLCEIFLDGKIKRVRIDDYILWKVDFLSGKEYKVKAMQVFFRKRFEQSALNLVCNYISELLLRVGLGGFPVEAPFTIILEVLGEYFNNLEFRFNLYSVESDVISIEAAKKSIEDLDTIFALRSIYESRVRHFS